MIYKFTNLFYTAGHNRNDKSKTSVKVIDLHDY